MKNDIKEKFKSLIPNSIRIKYSTKRYNKHLLNHKNIILKYYKNIPSSDITDEQKEVVEYLEKNPISVFPYDFCKSYISSNVEVFRDKANDLLYVLHDDKRLYFKRSWSEEIIKGKYNFLQIEQDNRSPHRYLTSSFFVSEGDVVIDVGVAEGNFALSVIEKVKKMYLFETDEEWIEALNITFNPWRDRVKIIHKFVSDRDDDKNITLDSMFKEKDKIDFIKIDVDGAERDLLKGCTNLLSRLEPIKVALCTYHKAEDEKEFQELLISEGFKVEFSKGYMIFLEEIKPPYRDTLKPPYLRRGLIRAVKSVK